jgi:hypothetical protein
MTFALAQVIIRDCNGETYSIDEMRGEFAFSQRFSVPPRAFPEL